MTAYEKLKRNRDRLRVFGGGNSKNNKMPLRRTPTTPKFKMSLLSHQSQLQQHSGGSTSSRMAASLAMMSTPPPSSGSSFSFNIVSAQRRGSGGEIQGLFRRNHHQDRVKEVPVLDSLAAQSIELEVQFLLQQKDGTCSMFEIAINVLRPAAQGLGRGSTWDSVLNNKSYKQQDRMVLKYQFLNAINRLMDAQRDNPAQVSSWGEAKEQLSAFMIFPPPFQAEEEDEVKQRQLVESQAESSQREQDLADFMRRLDLLSAESRRIGLTPAQRKLLAVNKAKPQEEEQENDSITLKQQERLKQAEVAHEERRKNDAIKKVEQQLHQEEQEEEARQRASDLMRPMDDEEQEMVREAIYGLGPEDEILAQEGADSVQRSSMQKLRPGAWLNDEAIHYFYVMLANRDAQLCEQTPGRRRSHFFKSFFMTKLLNEGHANPAKDGTYEYKNVKRWTKKVPGKDIFALDRIFFPINVGKVHWVCAVIYMQEKRIQFYDSFGGDGMEYLEYLFRFLQDEHLDKKGAPLPDVEEWKLIPCTEDTPRQLNCSDCGVFTCMFADFLSKDCPLLFNQTHINQCRERIALSILKGRAIL